MEVPIQTIIRTPVLLQEIKRIHGQETILKAVLEYTEIIRLTLSSEQSAMAAAGGLIATCLGVDCTVIDASAQLINIANKRSHSKPTITSNMTNPRNLAL